jgi:glycosyltransferase involved in cell wall biosynthesis
MGSEPLRVCQVNTVFNGGGIDSQTIQLSTGLRDLGHDVLLVLRAGCQWEPVAKSLSVRLSLLPASGWRKRLRVVDLARLFRTHRAQVVHAHQGRDYWPSILAARLAGVGTRVVITRHLMTRLSGMSRRFLLHAANVVAVSQAALTVLRQELRGSQKRLSQIYCGIDIAAFDPNGSLQRQSEAFRVEHGWTADNVAFGIIGRYGLPRGKGHLEFLEAAARIKAEFTVARFAIVGEGSLGTILRERIAVLGLQKEVAMVPFTPNIPPIMNGLDVVVHPATGTDAFPLVVLEGMVCGKPVIASRLDGIPEQFEDGIQGLLLPPGDVSALAEGMRRLLRDPECRARMGAAGRKHVCANFSKARQAQRYEALYKQLQAGPRVG